MACSMAAQLLSHHIQHFLSKQGPVTKSGYIVSWCRGFYTSTCPLCFSLRLWPVLSCTAARTLSSNPATFIKPSYKTRPVDKGPCTSLAVLEGEVAKLGQAVAAAKTEYDAAAIRLDELRQRLKECDKEISSLAADKAALAQQITDLAVEKKKLQHK